MNVILLESNELSPNNAVRLSDARARHMRSVLKVSAGGEVRMGVIDGPMGIGLVTHVDSDHVDLLCTLEPQIPERPRIDLLLALPRPKVMRRLWAQLAALGVGRVILTNAEKVERDYFDSHVLEEAGYRPLLIEGLQQARDTRMPQVTIHKRFKVLVEDELDALTPASRRIAAHPDDESGMGMRGALANLRAEERVLLAVGPEGGWNDFELNLLAAHRFQRVAMGQRTLATTTACIALLTLAHEYAATDQKISDQ